MKNGQRLKEGFRYLLNFTDPQQPKYSWYSGPGVFVRKAVFLGEGTKSHDEDCGECSDPGCVCGGNDEPHYEFRLPGSKKLYLFPRSSVVSEL